MRRTPLLILFSWCLTACQPPCAQLCTNMADYAQECGFEVPSSELDACIDEQSSSDMQKSCRIAGDPQTLRNEWSCEEVGIFFR